MSATTKCTGSDQDSRRAESRTFVGPPLPCLESNMLGLGMVLGWYARYGLSMVWVLLGTFQECKQAFKLNMKYNSSKKK